MACQRGATATNRDRIWVAGVHNAPILVPNRIRVRGRPGRAAAVDEETEVSQMSHMVIYLSADGQAGYEQVDDLGAAVAFVERIRNTRGIENSRIYRMEQVNYRFEPYYQVRLETGELLGGPYSAASPSESTGSWQATAAPVAAGGPAATAAPPPSSGSASVLAATAGSTAGSTTGGTASPAPATVAAPGAATAAGAGASGAGGAQGGALGDPAPRPEPDPGVGNGTKRGLLR